MTNKQWDELLDVVDGRNTSGKAIGFMVDSPWLPGWANVSIMDYYTSYDIWLKTNLKAIEAFPQVIFLPGFWSEYGMCTEPSAFGSRLLWYSENMPHAEKVIHSAEDIKRLSQPNVKVDGLLPFMINRLKNLEPNIKEAGHSIKFAVSRGPLNIATFLMGTTEFLLLLNMEPEKAHDLLERITLFICDWLSYQKECFHTIEGIHILDDIVGFIGEEECREFVAPYLKRAFAAFDAKIRFFHNDAYGLSIAPFFSDIRINLFNFTFNHTIDEMRASVGLDVALLGNLPPRDVLAAASPEVVYTSTLTMMKQVSDKSRIIWSCGGGMPQDVPSENINAFISAVNDFC